MCGKNENRISTDRLIIRMASDGEMRDLIARETDMEMRTAYGEMLDGCMQNPGQRQWYAVWLVIRKSGERIGDLCFKGLSADGMAEIGYGLLPEYWGCGYAAEAVTAMVEWALKQPGLQTIEAETDADNLASQRVLEKAGFRPTGTIGEEGPRFIWSGRTDREV